MRRRQPPPHPHRPVAKGRQMQTIIDSPDGHYFDIIGFDPRGVGHTTPKLEYYPDYIHSNTGQLAPGRKEC